MASTVGDKIKAKRISNGLTQAGLSEVCGVPQGYLSQIERGERRPSIDALRKLRDALGVKDEEFLRWIDLMPSRGRAGAA